MRGGKRSIGDVVKGVHGGKYQFSSGGFEAFAGREFAAALYESASGPDAVGSEEDAPWPKWATELRRPRGATVGEAADEEVEVVPLQDGTATVRVINVFLSWDRFYATIWHEEDGGRFEASPTCGDLAPRGGANNVCDETRPYLDHAVITVRARQPGAGTLLVRTEEEQWVFRLVSNAAFGMEATRIPSRIRGRATVLCRLPTPPDSKVLGAAEAEDAEVLPQAYFESMRYAARSRLTYDLGEVYS